MGSALFWLSERLAWLESQRHQPLRHLSHELKTPLTSMRECIASCWSIRVVAADAGAKEVVDILMTAALTKLIEQLLDYNRNW
ncbi:hypothetical protein KCP69_09670 [Salmonella enterica subsp. enterica]|nr:hypothetical protein KCP69_09670 [Salmonella enterica subsp. enterica]